MATKAEKQELMDILKFTPITVTLSIQGYGGESYAGTVSREDYEFFKKNKYDMDEYASGWDEDWDSKVPVERQPFPPGSPYECDNLWHASGAELSDLNTIRVSDENNNDIWEHSAGYCDLEESGVTVNETGGAEIADLDEGTIVFWGGQGEKGCFFDAEFTLRAPFDPKKLTINYENCDDWYIISSVEYDGEELDGSGGYSTTGKWSENKWIIVGDEEVYESVPLEEREEGVDYTQFPTEEQIDELANLAESEKVLDWSALPEEPKVTDWFDKDIKPAYKGTYEAVIDAPWPLSGIRMIEWTGRSWKEDKKKIAIIKWRGLAENPNGE